MCVNNTLCSNSEIIIHIGYGTINLVHVSGLQPVNPYCCYSTFRCLLWAASSGLYPAMVLILMAENTPEYAAHMRQWNAEQQQ